MFYPQKKVHLVRNTPAEHNKSKPLHIMKHSYSVNFFITWQTVSR